MASMILETQNLNKTFSGQTILSNCNMHVEAGTIYGLLGANGAGKTSIVKAATDLKKPRGGKTRPCGQSADRQGTAGVADIGLLMERPNFCEHLSAKENLAI